jgi:hypothetical protein
MNQIPTEPTLREHLANAGRAKTPAKIEAAKANAAKGAAARRKNALDVPCTCTGGQSLEATAHTHSCPRGRLLKQRERNTRRSGT